MTSLVRRVMPLTLVVMALALVTKLSARPLDNPDTWFHLRFGHEFLAGWSIRHPGHVSTLETADWVPTQWLPQVAMAWLEGHFGLPGVAWLAGSLFLCLTLVFYFTARQQAGALVSAAIVPFALVATANSLSMRPQILSYMFVCLTVTSWLRAKRTHRPPWHLIPLTWLWTMCHGMWPLGLFLSLVAAVGVWLDARAVGSQRAPGPRLVTWLLVPALSAAACLATPVGPRLFGAVLEVNSRAQYFSEWGPPDFTSAPCLALLVLLGATLVSQLRTSAPMDFTQLGLLVAAGGFAVYSTRTIPVAAAVAVSLAGAALQRWIGPRERTRRSEYVVLGVAAIVLSAVLAAAVPHTSRDIPPYPSWVDPALDGLPAGTVVLSDRNIGAFVMWRHPDLDVALHGYGDVYTDREIADRDRIERLQPGWDRIIQRMGVAYALVPPDGALGYALSHAQGWQRVHASKHVVLLRSPRP